ncbi:MAG TPA: hypothetical protein VG095_03390 [Chthoniobacterales bacterium]|nr:hypothetical protein [Chthoniobacterales bacterium]
MCTCTAIDRLTDLRQKTKMNFDTAIAILAVAGALLLVVTSLLNFSVFLRQLRATREQLENTRRMLENARQGPEIQLVQRAMMETSDHLRVLVEKPYLRPYFYDNKEWREGDQATLDEVKAMAELLLDNLASAIIHSAAFPQYPIRGVEQNIRFHLRQSRALRDYLMDAFDRFPMAGLALLSLKNKNTAETVADLHRLIEAAGDDEVERARRERLLDHLQTAENTEPLALAKYSFDRVRTLSLATCGGVARVAQ